MSSLRSFWTWLTMETSEKSFYRQCVEIVGLFFVFFLIAYLRNILQLRWLLISPLVMVLVYWESPREFIRIGLLAAVLVFGVVRPFIVQAFYIPSRSMENTLLVNDHIFVNKFVYFFSEPDRWDIVVFEYPDNPRKDYIKRLVARPGERMAIRKGVLSINGNPVRRRILHTETEVRLLSNPKPIKDDFPPGMLRFDGDAVAVNRRLLLSDGEVDDPVKFRVDLYQIFREAGDHAIKELYKNGRPNRARYSEEFGPIHVPRKGERINIRKLNRHERRYYYHLLKRRSDKTISIRNKMIYRNGIPLKTYTVPEDMYFVLGDNRDQSQDSRYWGFVPESRLLGEAVFIYWPPSRFGMIGEEWI